MAKLLNLRQARKRRARDDKRAEADANAARHGRTSAERRVQGLEEERARRELDGHRLDDD